MSIVLNNIFTKRLKVEKTKAGYSEYTLAVALGLSPSSVHFYLSGKTSPTVENLIKIADVFDVSADYLLGRTDKRNSHKTGEKS
jgi:transcriptional regulator with XRE-family HTH domain